MVAVVKMASEHIAQIAALEKLCFTMPWSENALRQELGSDCACFLTALDGEKVLGYIGSMMTDGCYITNVAVFPDERGRGVGSLLINSLTDKAKKRGCEFITLEVRVSNANAVRLYSQLGFKSVGERKNFYENPTENAIIMTKSLINIKEMV